MKQQDNDLGVKLREIRKKKKISQKDLAQELDVTQGYISKIETGDTMPTVELIKKLRKKYKVNLNNLLCP